MSEKVEQSMMLWKVARSIGRSQINKFWIVSYQILAPSLAAGTVRWLWMTPLGGLRDCVAPLHVFCGDSFDVDCSLG